MKTRKIYTLLVSLFVSSIVLGQDSLSNYLITAAQNNPGLKAKFNVYMASMEKVTQVGTLPDPQVAFGAFILPVETRLGPQQGKIGLSQMFPWFGLLGAKEDVATAAANAKYEIFEQAKSKLFYDVKTLYYKLYFVERSMETTQENIDILKTLQRLAIVKYEAAKGSLVNELRVEMEINDLDYQFHKLEDVKQKFSVEFNNLLAVDEGASINIPSELLEKDFSVDKKSIGDTMKIENHLIKQIEHRILSWEKKEIVAKKAGMPSFMIGADYIFIGKNDMSSVSENGKDALLLPKVSLTIPLYKKKYNSMISEAKLNLEASKYEKEDKLNQISSLLERAYVDLHDASDRISLYDKQIKLAEQSLELLTTEYSTDGENFEELLRMERKLIKYQLDIEKARTDAQVAFAFIDYLMGK